ncbi:TetR family transcriptional regulator [Motilibacter rhizosphaerae]|uniref:TetR family transcriptional regulator n=1 Tax=Motilibacter rhizosphaerae TaxID=598652 RepID=A0A4Q7NRM4_9ACTN|nr:TetR/AcrR family transcriptional regulator [Motilibacter rhizosphaerae]RZS89490.1 TetR family transcriptional regulator [Motilibacter rhizosphaerae]
MTEAPTRRTDTRTRIVEAAARLLQEGGPAAVTTRATAEAAGVQAPAIYRLFGDKEGLLEAVAEHVLATYVSSKAQVVRAAAAQDVDPLEDLRAGWQSQLDFELANPALSRLIRDPARALRSPALQSGMRVLEARVHRLAVAGLLAVHERQAVDVIAAAGSGTVSVLLATPPEERDLTLADRMLDAALSQILVSGPVRGAAGVRPAAVALRASAAGLTALSEPERALLVEWLDRIVAAG